MSLKLKPLIKIKPTPPKPTRAQPVPKPTPRAQPEHALPISIPKPAPPKAKVPYVTADHITISADPLVGEVGNERVWAIQKQAPLTEADYHFASQLALYWYYNKKLGCSYNAAIHRRLDALSLMP